jgi:hypothetical protein
MSRARLSAAHPVPAASADVTGPQRLVGLGFRYWLTGIRMGDISCWERAWCAYSGALGADAAKCAVTDLSCWVRAISHHAQRPLETSPVDCARFCRDECTAIAMIAACQHNACPAMRACAFSLLGCSLIDEVVHGAESFAATMRVVDQVLPPSFVHGSALLTMEPASSLRQ